MRQGTAMYQFGSGSALQVGLNAIRIPNVALPCLHRPGCNGLAKRLIDVLGAVLLIVILAVPMLAIALAVRLDSPGPILFRQKRIGYASRAFETLKFRTMWHCAAANGTLRQTCRHDTRVTRVGHFLRHTSMDELPQLFNVLRGDMSLVGPRPHAPGTRAGGKPFELVTPHYHLRHRVRPGMTGLAQVRGLRGETETEDLLLRRVESDLEYIESWSLWLDLMILLRTAKAVLGTQNAY